MQVPEQQQQQQKQRSEESVSVNAALDADPFVIRKLILNGESSRPRTAEEVKADEDVAMLQKQGYVIIENVLTCDEVQSIRETLAPHLRLTGRNKFEGARTQRVNAVLSKTRSFYTISMV